MKAVVLTGFGEADVLTLGEVSDPVPRTGELLVRIKATALNRADVLQRRGHYPPPEGAPATLGLEMAGEVVAVGADAQGWKPGDRVCALLPVAATPSLPPSPRGWRFPFPKT